MCCERSPVPLSAHCPMTRCCSGGREERGLLRQSSAGFPRRPGCTNQRRKLGGWRQVLTFSQGWAASGHPDLTQEEKVKILRPSNKPNHFLWWRILPELLLLIGEDIPPRNVMCPFWPAGDVLEEVDFSFQEFPGSRASAELCHSSEPWCGW